MSANPRTLPRFNGAAASMPRKCRISNGICGQRAGASMGPRHRCRGNEGTRQRRECPDPASMGPRHRCRGNSHSPILFCFQRPAQPTASGRECHARLVVALGPTSLQVVQTHSTYPLRAVPVFSSPPGRSHCHRVMKTGYSPVSPSRTLPSNRACTSSSRR